MRTRHLCLFLLLLVSFGDGVSGQPPHRRRNHHRERERLDEMRRGIPRHELERRRWRWDEVLDELSPQERAHFRSLSFEAKEVFIRDALERRQAAERAAFLASLSTEESASLEGLKGKARERRLQEIRLARQLERILADAVEREIIDAARAKQIRGGSALEQARAMVDLQKRIFLVVHAEEFAQAPESLRTELTALAPTRFFGHEWVKGFRRRGPLSAAGLASLREAGREAIEAFLERLAAGKPTPADEAWLSEKALRDVRAPEAPRRRRLVRHLRRTLFRRDLRPEDRPGPHRGPRGRQVMPPPRFMDQLTEAERAEFHHMPNEGRRRFLEERFPDWWRSLEDGTAPRIPPWFGSKDGGRPGGRRGPPGGRGPGGRRGPGPGGRRGPPVPLGDLIDWWDAQPPESREALRELPLREVIERHLRPRDRGPGRPPRRGRPPRDG